MFDNHTFIIFTHIKVLYIKPKRNIIIKMLLIRYQVYVMTYANYCTEHSFTKHGFG